MNDTIYLVTVSGQRVSDTGAWQDRTQVFRSPVLARAAAIDAAVRAVGEEQRGALEAAYPEAGALEISVVCDRHDIMWGAEFEARMVDDEVEEVEWTQRIALEIHTVPPI